ncbi:MAG: ornithine carbamoyltransferase [Spirochaetes bacterium GWF1_41_5]|nr:MAG: ornithine carbamoyltransferase [Spirochaetes bacterium GWF1_41_5]
MIGEKKDFISLEDFTAAEITGLVKLAADFKKHRQQKKTRSLLAGKKLGMIFAKNSTRTRVSFETGIYELGGMGIFLSQNDLQLGRGETVSDTGHVLERYIDAIMIRTHAHSDVLELARAVSIPVINGLTDWCHPCQILADLLTVWEQRKTLKNLKVAYIGDGNNVANSWIYAAQKLGFSLCVASPASCAVSDKITDSCHNKNIRFTEDPEEAARDADILYTDVWVSMGQEAGAEERIKALEPYQINAGLASLAKKDYIFLHCLPAHRGQEVSADIIDGPHSLIFAQAENRLHAQKAVMYRLMK